MRSPNAIDMFFILLCFTYGTAAALQIVDIGNINGTLAFTPENTVVAAGDLVEFRFRPANHSVAQSNFSTPCQPMNSGFFSGFSPMTSAIVCGPLFSKGVLLLIMNS
jgi:hypothetical protein